VLQFRAQVVQAAPAHYALATGHEGLDGNPVTDRDVGDPVPDLDDFANQFVAQHLPGNARQNLRHAPSHNVDITAADAGYCRLDQHFPGSRLWRRDLPDFKQARFNEDCSTHREILSGFSR
jgi:hypothetical protein